MAAGCTIESMKAPAKAFSGEVGTGSREKTRRTVPPAGAGRGAMEHKAPERAIKGLVMLQRGMLDIEMSFRDGPKDQTTGAQLRTGESRDSGFDAPGRATRSRRIAPE
ncbi:hypothetical protein BDS110ZK4_16940 [Bradyrhizobium diazoefficiens]|nr:hypothetical protein BDHF08_68760 [Bradyrhizobium diazoefficiens]BCF72710.1 hypothetical protein XF19B_70630 [Bradyrhizobium diazoefficiens]